MTVSHRSQAATVSHHSLAATVSHWSQAATVSHWSQAATLFSNIAADIHTIQKKYLAWFSPVFLKLSAHIPHESIAKGSEWVECVSSLANLQLDPHSCLLGKQRLFPVARTMY